MMSSVVRTARKGAVVARVAPRAVATVRSRAFHAAQRMEGSTTVRDSTILTLVGTFVAVQAYNQYTCPADAKTGVNLEQVKKAILKVFEEDENRGPTFIRLSWHASGTYDKQGKTGGSGTGASMRYEPECKHGANAGLKETQKLLEPIKAQFPEISYADLWAYAAVVVIEAMGGPTIPFRLGRVDCAGPEACTPDGRLPDADKGNVKVTIQHLRDIFYRQGFTDREIVALAGAHAMGRCHTDRSGYDGPWTRAPTTFSNEYFRLLTKEQWTVRDWNGPQQWENEAKDLMMLPADMALIWDREFLKYVRLYAQDEKAFAKDFASAFQKLQENGVDFAAAAATGKPWWQFW